MSPTTLRSARHFKACRSEHLPVLFAGLPLGLLETCDQHLGELLFRVPTMVTHVGQKQFVHNWAAQASNANQVLLPTREGLIHLFFRNQQVSLGDSAPQRRLSVRRHQCAHTSSRERRATLGLDGPIGIAVVVPNLVLFRRSLINLCGFIRLPVLWLWSVATAKELIHGKPGSHPSYCAVHGEKRQSSKALHRTNESKQLEATLITQAAIQASRLLTSGLLFGLVGRDQRPARRTLETWSDVTGDDGSFFLEPMLTMVINQCQDYESIACALRSGLLKTELKEKQPQDQKKQPQDFA